MVFILSLIILIIPFQESMAANSYFDADANKTTKMQGISDKCNAVKNSSDDKYFIPNNSVAEWDSFVNTVSGPNNETPLSLSGCSPTYPGTWTVGNCSASCGGGTLKEPNCSGGNCDPSTKPASGEGTSCNTQSCGCNNQECD